MSKYLGHSTAYGYAKENGYTGTEEEFAELMASYADVAEEAQEAREGAEAAQTGAETARNEAQGFSQTATTKASEASQSASQASQSASQASASAGTATAKASEASQSATVANNKASEASTYAQTAVTAKNDAVTAKTGAETARTQAQTAKTQAETAKTGAETAQGLAEDARDSAQATAQDISEHLTQIDTNTEDIAEINETLERKANIDGYYEDLTSGNAEQLVSTQYLEDKIPYHFRASGGSLDIGNREEDMIVGGSIVWNQLVSGVRANTTINGLTFVNKYPQLSISGTCTTSTSYTVVSGMGGYIEGHVYGFMLGVNRTNDYGLFVNGKQPPIGADGVIYKKGTSPLSFGMYVFENATIDVTIMPQAFDLTAMFGAEVADAVYAMEQAEAGAGVAWFKKLFPKDYYEYCEPELKHVEGVSAHETVGKNLFADPVVAYNPYSSMTFNKAKFFKGGLNYTISVSNVTNTTKWRLGFRLFDANGNVITFAKTNGYVVTESFIDSLNNGTVCMQPSDGTTQSRGFTLLKDAYIVFCFALGDVSANTKVDYQVEIGNTATAYEPYVKHSYPLDSTLTLRGIPKIDASGNLYYDGDTYESDGTVTRKYGIVDLGTLTWNYSYTIFYASMQNYDPLPKYQGNLLCTQYINRIVSLTNPTDMSIYMTNSQAVPLLRISDSRYTDAATFKTAMSGVMLVYELATPTTETAQPYTALQTVDASGTEEYVTTSLVPVGHEAKYPQDLRAKLEHLPSLADSEGNYIIQQSGGNMSLTRFRIPQAPTENGTYVLKATVSGGTPTYTWEAVNEG